MKDSFLKFKRYFVKEPGALFIIVFEALILSCAFLLIQGNEALADEDAVLAYCFLAAGIVLQAVSLVRGKLSGSEFG